MGARVMGAAKTRHLLRDAPSGYMTRPQSNQTTAEALLPRGFGCR